MTLKLTNPDEIKFKLEVELSLLEWRYLKKQLGEHNSAYPACDFIEQINAMIRKADAEFTPSNSGEGATA